MQQQRKTRRGFTPINRAGQALPDNAQSKGHLAAFTLIELLVVVLIIGILAAVAVPQYKKAVIKTKYMHLVAVGMRIAQAQKVYFLENGYFATNLEELPISLDTTKFSVGVDIQRAALDNQYFNVTISSRNLKYMSYYMRFYSAPRFLGIYPSCYIDNGSAPDIYKRLCDEITGHEGSQTSHYSAPFDSIKVK